MIHIDSARRFCPDIQDVVITVEKLEKELADLKDRVADDKLLRKVADLQSKMEKFLNDKR